MTKTLPTLYSKTSKGGIEQWSVWVEGDKLFTEHGLVGGKLQTSSKTIKGKNLGKSNETTPEEQAEKQALAEWTKQKSRKGYTEDFAKAQAGGNDGAGGLRPMLAKKWTEHGDKVLYPIYVQPKLDGIRCIAIVNADRTVTLWSREQKEFKAPTKIAEQIAAMNLPPGTILDGELYNHELRSDFEKIASCTRKPYPASDEEQALIQYHVYDLPSQDGHFGTRYVKLAMTLSKDYSTIKLVETKFLKEEDELEAYFRHCRDRGYEGCMIRALTISGKKGAKIENDCYEEDTRSYFLLKMKEFDEDEFPIIGTKEGVGKMAGCAVFTCKTKEGNEFDVKMEGSLDGLRKYLYMDALWKGKKLTVQYQGFTNKNHVPRFPVGKVVRDYE